MSSQPPVTPPDSNGNNDDNKEDSEDLMNDDMGRDYEPDAKLDVLDEKDLDHGSYDAMSAYTRRQADVLLDERDRRENRGRRGYIPHSFMNDDEDIPAYLQQRGRSGVELDAELAVADDESGAVNLEDYDGPLSDWLLQERVRREIKIKFKQFLTQFTSEDSSEDIAVYPRKIQEMCEENDCSLVISYDHLSQSCAILGQMIVEQPQTIFDLFDEVAMEVAQISFPNYSSIRGHIHVRLSGIPLEDNLRDLRQSHLNALICVKGVVTERTPILPQLLLIRYDCLKCGYLTAPISQLMGNDNSLRRSGGIENRPKSCPECQSSGPFRMNESASIYRNFQKIVVQESPNSVGAGLIPRSRDVYLMDDLCDRVRPGEEIEITGIYKNIFDVSLNAHHGFPVFSTVIQANHFLKAEDLYSAIEMTDEDRIAILNLSKNPQIEQMIIDAIAPSIYGYQYIKRSLAYALFGGMEKSGVSKHRIRGDINMLILGDPGCGKSQFLKYMQGLAFRAVFSTGKGASGVGLTASVNMDAMTGEWTLKGGALVMADRGVCLIDEFDKMNDHDRTSIHEAMEQQSISISKAGIVATLHARCSVIAAANPIRGRYDGSLTFVQNVDLTDPLLSRFDVLAVVRDMVDPIRDERLASFVVHNHINSHPQKTNIVEQPEEEKEEELISQELLRKYIIYAKRNCHPKLDNIDQNKVSTFYSDLRQKSMEGGGIPIAVRHVESLMRLSEARAKMHLRDYVNEEDVNMAIRVILKSFIDTQKQSVQSRLRKHYKKYLSYQTDINELLMHILHQEVKEEKRAHQLRRPVGNASDDVMGDVDEDEDKTDMDVEIDMRYFEQRAVQQMQITPNDFRNFYQSPKFIKYGFVVNDNRKIVIHF